MCTYRRVCVCTYPRVYVSTCLRIYVLTYLRLYVSRYLRVYVCTYRRVCVCTYPRVYVSMCLQSALHICKKNYISFTVENTASNHLCVYTNTNDSRNTYLCVCFCGLHTCDMTRHTRMTRMKCDMTPAYTLQEWFMCETCNLCETCRPVTCEHVSRDHKRRDV